MWIHKIPTEEGLYGAIHHVSGIGFIATDLFGLPYIPLIPQGCYVVLEETAKHPHMRFRIAQRWSSIVLAWMRSLLILAPSGYAVYWFYLWVGERLSPPGTVPSAPNGWPILLPLTIGSVVLYVVTHKLLATSPDELRAAIEEAEIPEYAKESALARLQERE